MRAFLVLALIVAVANAQFGFTPSFFGGDSGGSFGAIRVVTSSCSSSTSKSFTSVRASFSGSDVLTVDMTTSPVPAVSFDWVTAGFSGANTLRVTAAFPEIIEFETGATVGYSTSKGGVALAVSWEITASNCDDSGSQAYWTTFTGNNGTFQINCTLPQKTMTVNGLSIVPTSVKCDFIVNNYQYNSSTSRLALKNQFLYQSTTVGTGIASSCGFGLCVSASNGKGHAYLDWVKTADISGGGSVSVVTNSSSSTTTNSLFSGFIGTDIYFTFNSNTPSFIWDPAFGVTDQSVNPPPPPSSSEASVTSVAFAALAIIAALVVLL